VLAALSACDAASSDLGRDALLQVPGAQWAPGPPPELSGGPDIDGVFALSPNILRDRDGVRITGAAGPATTGWWIGLDGDLGGWILPAGAPSVDTPLSPSLTTELTLAATAPLGPLTVRFIATDDRSRSGAPFLVDLIADDAPPPTGELVFALVWDGAADLDLHLVAPDGNEAWSGDPNTWEPPPPGTPPDPNAWRTGGLLDHDANAGCRRDARPREHVIWTMPPPAGHYILRVDARALCGAASSYWFAAAYRNGTLLTAAEGLATPEHVRLPHGAGAGITALALDLTP
jgi:hypothetical protein